MSLRSILHRTPRPARTTRRHRGDMSLEQALSRATSPSQRDELLFLKSTR